MYAVLALQEVRVGEVGQAVSPAKCQSMFEYLSETMWKLQEPNSSTAGDLRLENMSSTKSIYSGARASAFGKMNPRITGYARAESTSVRIRSLPALSLLPRFGCGPAPAGRRNR